MSAVEKNIERRIYSAEETFLRALSNAQSHERIENGDESWSDPDSPSPGSFSVPSRSYGEHIESEPSSYYVTDLGSRRF